MAVGIDGVGKAPGALQGDTVVEMKLAAAGLLRNRSRYQWHGIVELAELGRHDAQEVQRVRVIGIHIQERTVQCFCLREVPGAVQFDGRRQALAQLPLVSCVGGVGLTGVHGALVVETEGSLLSRAGVTL